MRTARLSPLLLLSALLPALAAAAPSAAPVTYILDYGQGHLGNDKWLADTIAAGPQVLHLGKDVPMSHSWGPIQGLGGENQAYGKGDNVRRLTPAEVRARIVALTDMVRRLHEGGVPVVMPYICAMTIAGDPDKRTGFWEFYDHWSDYAEFGLGPRPADDPRTWLQVNPDGTPYYFYALTDGKYPPFELNLRYAVCMNNPNWRRWSEQVVRLCATVGYDGVFVDNGGSQRCYCRYCQEGFGKWLAGRYQPAGLERLFGQREAAKVGLADAKANDLRGVESRRFWIDSFRRHHLALKAAGEAVRRPFYIFPNGGEERPQDVKLGYPQIDFLMYERSTGDWGTNPGRAERRIVRDIRLYHYNDNVFETRLTAAVGGLERPLLLTRGGYPQEPAALQLNATAAATGLAEMAAFGNGGGFLLRPQYAEYGPLMRKWRAFHEANAGLYTSRTPYAQVALACFPEQNLYGNRTHIARVRALTEALGDCHVLYDYVLEEGFTATGLKPYSAVIVPDLAVMTAEQVTALGSYARAGGKVLLIGENARTDELLKPCTPAPLPSGDLAPRAAGEGLLASRRLPPSARELWELLGAMGVQGLSLLSPEADARVWFNAFLSADGNALQVHVVNYDAPLGREGKPLVIRENLVVGVPLPKGYRAVGAEVLDPDAPGPTRLAAEGAKTVELRLPPLHSYQAVIIRLQKQ